MEDCRPLTASTHKGMEDLKHDLEKGGVSTATTRLYMAVYVLLLLGVFGFCMDFLTALSCREDFPLCLPQVTLKITDQTTEAKKSLATIREGLKMASYMATDFGVPSELTSDADYLNTIDTFSTDNLFKFGYSGFCRYDPHTLMEYCINAIGLDVVSCIVTDVGLQLGSLHHSNDSMETGRSLASMYLNVLRLFDEFYYKAVHNELDRTSLKMQQLTAAHSLVAANTFSKHMAHLPMVTMPLLALVCGFVVVGCFRRWPKWVVVVLLVVHGMVVLSRVVLEGVYFSSLQKAVRKFELAVVHTGFGYSMLVTMVVLDVVVLGVFLLGKQKG